MLISFSTRICAIPLPILFLILVLVVVVVVVVVGATSSNKMPRYRRDHRAMRPIYECPENNVSAKSVNDCARTSALQSYHYSAVKLFSKYSIQCDHGT